MQINTNRAYLGDCLEIMRYIPDKSINLVVADLPYAMTKNGWDILIDPIELWKQYTRIIKDNGCFALCAKQPFTTDLINSNRSWYKYSVYWKKNTPSGHLNSKVQPLNVIEEVCIFSPKARKVTYNYSQIMRLGFKPYVAKAGKGSSNFGKQVKGTVTVSNGERYPLDLWDDIIAESNSKKLHPTQKPLDLIERLIKVYSNEGETILDNCAGSFTTMIAALNTSRKYICIEKESEYFEVGKRRLIQWKQERELNNG